LRLTFDEIFAGIYEFLVLLLVLWLLFC